MSQLDEFAGSALRDALDASSQDRRQGAVRRTQESMVDQEKRLEASARRAADVAQDALNVHEQLLENSQQRRGQAARDAEKRVADQAQLQQQTALKLEQYAVEREVGAITRAVRRAEERAVTAVKTHQLLADASLQRSKVRSELEGFRTQLHRNSTGVTRLDSPKAVSVAKPRAVAVPARRSVVIAPATVANMKVGAMQNPDPMTAIARRRENVLIKMIAANPGMLLSELEKNLYMDTGELHGILKRLISSGRVTHSDDAYRITKKSIS